MSSVARCFSWRRVGALRGPIAFDEHHRNDAIETTGRTDERARSINLQVGPARVGGRNIRNSIILSVRRAPDIPYRHLVGRGFAHDTTRTETAPRTTPSSTGTRHVTDAANGPLRDDASELNGRVRRVRGHDRRVRDHWSVLRLRAEQTEHGQRVSTRRQAHVRVSNFHVTDR